MSHPPLHEVVAFEIVGPYTLKVEFEDGTTQVIDFKPVLAGELFGPLLDLKMFNQVKLDPESRNLVWPNGADFDPSDLHDWPEVAEGFAERAKEWRKQASITR